MKALHETEKSPVAYDTARFSRFSMNWMTESLHQQTVNDSHNSPEYCPLVPRNSACSEVVHCCGCRGPSVLRGPVEPLEEAVPDELWPPGEGNDGLLYGRHPSSENTKRGRKTSFKFADITHDFNCCSETRPTSDAWKQRALCNIPLLMTSAEWQCQQAMPGRATERTLSLTHGLPSTNLMRG